MNFQDYVRDAFAPIAVPPDPPGMPPRAHLYQTPSDRMRDKGAEFTRLLVGLVPDPAYHTVIVDVMHDLIVGGEFALRRVLEESEEWKRDGHKLKLEHAPMRTGYVVSGDVHALRKALFDKHTELEALKEHAAERVALAENRGVLEAERDALIEERDERDAHGLPPAEQPQQTGKGKRGK